jgi:hypothetical protein
VQNRHVGHPLGIGERKPSGLAGLKPGDYGKHPFDEVAGAAVHCNYEFDVRAAGGI